MAEEEISGSPGCLSLDQHSDLHTNGSSYERPPMPQQLDSADSSSLPRTTSLSPRRSIDGSIASDNSRWPDGLSTAEDADVRDTSFGGTETATLVDQNFDENVLRALCDLNCGIPLLLDRIKQGMISCREGSSFLKKRAAIEEEYARSMQKLARSTTEAYAMNDGKAGSYVIAWQASVRVHERLAENRLKFSHRLHETSEELLNLSKEVDKSRKLTKDLATRYERALQESEALTEKSKNRLDATSEELERLLLQKEGESFRDNPVQARSGAGGKRVIGKAVAKGGLLLKGKNPGNIQRQEDDVRQRMSAASDAYRKAVTDTQAMRQEYFNFQLPRILRTLKETNDEIDLGIQYHLTRYAFLFESTMLSDGTTLAPTDDDAPTPGLKAAFESIDNRKDFRTFMQNYAYAHNDAKAGPRREGPADEGFLPPLPVHHGDKNNSSSALSTSPNTPNGAPDKGRSTFGVDLAEQMVRDNVEVPRIVEKCCQAIEKYGLRSQGIYRLSGTTSKVQNLRQRLDKDLDSVDLDSQEWSSDINNVASVIKQWLRELPDPLLTYSLRQGFVEAARIENDRLRHIRLHERVNDLPDANYATLKYIMGHLHRITQHSEENAMTMSNLAIVFGPTMFGQMTPSTGADGQVTGGLGDMPCQNLAIETILKHYTDIFVDESEET
ncbi:Rho GTPase activation protein [Schizophyllum amplum]|uniref:Rho GTPase activation protein n=1 Tax=Schizophyllum amplum TaxID=97359 RepID=A0A550CKU8_9AGAR|nr:Rho GTPase activation protein [Auriculariopsis ampla]